MPPSDLRRLVRASRSARGRPARALLHAAFADRLRGDDEAARLEALRALPRGGLSTRVALTLCEAAAGGWDDAARRAAGRAVGRLPGLPAARLQLLLALLDASRDPRARERIRREVFAVGARLARGGGARWHARRSRRLEARGRADLAILHQRLVCELRPVSSRALARLALLCARAGRREEAERGARAVAALAPRDPRALFDAAEARRALGPEGAAAPAFRQVLALDPGHGPSLRRLAEILCRDEETAVEAEGLLDRLLAAERDDPLLLYWRGLARGHLGKVKEAERDLALALRARPAWEECEEALARARQRRKALIPAPRPAPPDTPEEELEFETPDVDFDDVVGHDEAKAAIRRLLVLPALHADLAARYGVPRGGGLLLYGPPGTGKTLLARAAAKAAGARLLAVRLPDVLSKYIGETEKSLSGVFAAARAHQPCVLFFDELEALGGRREEIEHRWERSFAATFLVELSRLCLDPAARVLVIGCTNLPWTLDRALLRRGRFGLHVAVNGPGPAERESMFRRLLSGPARDLDHAELARLTENCSGALIRGVCEDASARVFEAAASRGEEIPVTMDDLRAAIARTAPDLARWREEAKRFDWFAAGRGESPPIGFAA